jgi:hypothetical protein
MPVLPRPDGTTGVHFDEELEISPYELFRLLREGRAPVLIDVRPEPGELTFAGARRLDPRTDLPKDTEAVLFDEDGLGAYAFARQLRERGNRHARALFGGLRLYDFGLDPAVVGEERFLLRRIEPASASSQSTPKV